MMRTRDLRKRQTTRVWWVAGLIKQGTLLGGFCWAVARRVDFCIHPTKLLSFYIGPTWYSHTHRALTGFSDVPSSDSLVTTSLSEGCVLEKLLVLGRREEWMCKHRGGNGEPPITKVQFPHSNQQSCLLNDLP